MAPGPMREAPGEVTCERYQGPTTRPDYGKRGLARIDRKASKSVDRYKAGQRGKRKAGAP